MTFGRITKLIFLDKKKYDVTVSKTINLNTAERPCYEGSDYNDQEYLRLAELMREKLNCSTPFVPKHLRLGLPVCPDNGKIRQAGDLLRTRVGYMNPNMWNKDYFFVPPCTYYEFNLYELSHRESLQYGNINWQIVPLHICHGNRPGHSHLIYLLQGD